MSQIKLVAMDIDDTLLNDEKFITDANKQAIAQALDQGVKIVLSSGRTRLGMKDYLDSLNISGDDQYIITNGGSLVESISGKVLYKKTLSNQTYRQIDDFIVQNDLRYNAVDVEEQTYTSNSESIDRYTIIQAFENDKGLLIRTPDQMPEDFEILKAIINESKAKLDQITELVEEEFGQNYYVIRTGAGFLEIMPKGTDKGSALEALAEHLNLDMTEVMAIGDGENDVPMLKKAGTSVVMDNATDKIKKLANFVTTDSNQSGVAKAFEKCLFN